MDDRESDRLIPTNDFDSWFQDVLLEAFQNAGITDPKQIEEYTQEAAESLVSELSNKLFDSVEKRAPRSLAKEREYHLGFESRLHELWGVGLDFLQIELHLAREIGANWRARTVREGDGASLKFSTVARLHARGCLVAAEVLELLSSGFAAGASARWRTLHEIAVIVGFLAKHDEDVAKRYCDFFHVEFHSSMVEHQRRCHLFGCEPYSDEEMGESEQRIKDLETTYGASFVKGFHGWAADALGKKRPTFADIEKETTLVVYRPAYKISCRDVHAGPRSLFDIPGLLGDDDILLAGASNAGLLIPGCNTAQSLAQVTNSLPGLSPTVTNTASLSLLVRVMNRAMDEFAKSEEELVRRHTASNDGSDTVVADPQ